MDNRKFYNIRDIMENAIRKYPDNIAFKIKKKERKLYRMCECVENKIKEEVRKIMEPYKQEKDNLIPILNEVQEKYGYIPKVAQMEISKYLEIPMAEIYGVITFYARFTLEPKGKYNISVCLGTACFVKGSQSILDRLKERLNLEEGKTSADGKYSIDTTRCVGACGIAPVFTVNDEVYGHATVKKLDEVLDELEK